MGLLHNGLYGCKKPHITLAKKYISENSVFMEQILKYISEGDTIGESIA